MLIFVNCTTTVKPSYSENGRCYRLQLSGHQVRSANTYRPRCFTKR